MERHQILEGMGELKLTGMRHAYDEVVADAVKRQNPVPRVVGDLLTAEIDEKQARSIRYQMTIAKLPLAKEIVGFDFATTPINEGLVRELAGGGFLASQRNPRWWAAPAPARPTSPSRSAAPACATAPGSGSTTRSTW